MAVPLEFPTNGETYFTAITIVVSIIFQDRIRDNYNKADGFIKKLIALTWSVLSVVLLSTGLLFIYNTIIILVTSGVNLVKYLF